MGALAVRWHDHAGKDPQATDQARSTNDHSTRRPHGTIRRIDSRKASSGCGRTPQGRAHLVEALAASGPLFRRLYVDGALIIERGTLWDLLELLGRNQPAQRGVPGNSVIGPLQAFLSWMRRGDSRRAARRHVAHHYDLPHEHYRRFLDADLQYSCAYFSDPSFSLEQAQEAKKRHIAAKLILEPGIRVLDIGCGWGGLALSLAEMERVEVVGVTLSREQLTVAGKRAKQAQLEERVRFTLQDYHEVDGRFDRIVSVGMFEHVGTPNYATFFQKIRNLFAPEGIALIHSIGRINGPAITSAWTRKYIYLGGHLP